MKRKTGPTGITAALAGLIWLSLASVSPAQSVSPNDTARYLAGLQPSAGSPLATLTRENGWVRHAATLDQAWARLEKRQLSRVRAWSKQYLPEQRPLMLYMFSGPDFLYADAFFPNATTYVLSALEPVGPLPDVTRLPHGARSFALQELRGSMQTVLSYSFFITKEMKSDLRGGRLPGALPLLYVFLARAGKTIQSVEFVDLNDDGTVTRRGERKSKGSAPGVRIVFAGEAGEPRTLYYFRTDLSNGGLKNSGFREFCKTLGPADSLVKSASYLLHSGNFSLAREFLLERSAAIVQDDSGIPVKYFSEKEWALHPFGRYLGPISVFPNRYQREMQRLFSGNRAGKIDFGIGYRWRTHETNVLLAVRKSPPPAKTD